jgi:chemotaxis protein MotB
VSRRKRHGSHPNHERWLVSYADFITLLFAFFVVMYSTAQVDQRKVGKLALAIQVAFQELGVFQASSTRVPLDMQEPMPFSTVQAIENVKRNTNIALVVPPPGEALGGGGGGENGDLTQLQHELESALSSQIARKEIAMRREPDGLVISLREVGFFESGSAQMKATSQESFDQIANLLHARDYRLRIEGHTDNVPIHTGQFASNWELSTARATELVRLLIVRDGFSPSRLSAAGYAEYHPVADNGTNEGRGMNRRVDIVILGHALAALPVASEGNSTAKPSPAISAKPRSKSD